MVRSTAAAAAAAGDQHLVPPLVNAETDLGGAAAVPPEVAPEQPLGLLEDTIGVGLTLVAVVRRGKAA